MRVSLFHRDIVVAVVLVASICGCSKTPELIDGPGLLVLVGATLIDGTGGSPLPNAVVVLSGKQVLRVGRTGDFRFPEDATTLDLSGRYIVPGFVDMHVHPRVGAARETMRMLLAFGITTIRIPGVGFDAPDRLGVDLREGIASGALVGPRVFTGAKFIEGPRKSFPDEVEVKSEAEMRAEVRRQAALGVDLVKLYRNTPPSFVRAAVDEAHSLNLQVLGHLRETSWTEAAKARIDGLVHSAKEGPGWELAPPEHQAELRPLPPRAYYARLQELIDLKSRRFDSLVAALVSHRVTVDPTLVVMQSLYFGDDLRQRQRITFTSD